MTGHVLEKRTSRFKLPIRTSPYFMKVTKGVRLGYYRGKAGGSWYASIRLGSDGYKTFRIGMADDVLDADGVVILDIWQAHDAARKAANDLICAKFGGRTQLAVYRVANAVEDYLEEIKAEKSANAVRGALYVFNAHILPSLGPIAVEKLTKDRLGRWLREIAASPRRVRVKKGLKYQPAATLGSFDDDQVRARRATANRVLTYLKAALNRAFEADRVDSDSAWRRLKPFKNVDKAIERYLTISEQRGLVAACDNDFGQIVKAALHTGCRYSEITNLRCRDFNLESKLIYVRRSKGKERYVHLAAEGVAFMHECTKGRPHDGLIFLRSDGASWGASHQRRRIAAASAHCSLAVAATFHILRHTYASQLAMKGVSMQIIAKQLGHADDRITTKHYAHLSPDFVRTAIESNFPVLDFLPTP